MQKENFNLYVEVNPSSEKGQEKRKKVFDAYVRLVTPESDQKETRGGQKA